MNTSRRKSLALFELVIVILFFAISAVVLARVFAKAKLMSEDSFAGTAGLAAVQDTVERWKTDPVGAEQSVFLSEGWESKKTDGKVLYSIYFDKEMEPALQEESFYRLEAVTYGEDDGQGTVFRIQVKMISQRSGETLIDISTAEYVADRESTNG